MGEKPRPLHRFQALLWEKPHRVWVGVYVWRTAEDMRKVCVRSRDRYDALTWQFNRRRGQVAQIHFRRRMLGHEVICHEAMHAGLHVARLFDICTEEEEEAVVRVTEHIISQIYDNIGSL